MTVYTRIGMGLGNQMFQYAAGLALSTALGRDLVVDLAMFGGEDSYGGETPRKYELKNVFGIEARQASREEHLSFSYSQPVRRAWNKLYYRRNPLLQGLPYEQPLAVTQTYRVFNLVKPAHRLTTYYEPHYHHDRHFTAASENPVYLIGHWQSWRYSNEIVDQLRQIFRVRPELIGSVTDLASAMRSTDSVGLHVRMTDRTSKDHYKKLFGGLGAGYYEAAIKHLERTHHDLKIYLFSDDPEAARDLLPRSLDATVVSGDITSSSAEDLHLMMQCRHNVIANSSFSWWAAHLNTNDGHTVIAPSGWYATRRYNTRDLYPPSWITIPNHY
ncbi:MAG: alpha-1,2-fucosyltransferase [Microthrixaceae bacterium]